MKLLNALPNGCPPYKELLRMNSSSLIVRAAACSGDLYTKAYLAELESYSPLRFQFVKQRQQQVAASAGSHAKFFEAFFRSEDDELRFPAVVCNAQNGQPRL